MDGYGDSAYRQAMKRISPHIQCITEFYSADGLVHSKLLADSVLPHSDAENPLIVQIFWKDPDVFAQAAKIIAQKKYSVAGIDINMGCPAKKVVRSGHGSSLMISENTAFDIVKAMDEATDLPISVKTRLSFDGNQNLITFAQWLQKAGAKLITIHGRTAKQAYTGNADFTDIYELKKNLDIPVICNGDILNFSDGMKKVQNLDGFMIGRKTFGNPWCFLPEPSLQQIYREENPDSPLLPLLQENSNFSDPKNYICGSYKPSLWEILDAMEFHALKLVETKGEKKGSLEIRKHLVQYIHAFPWARDFRKRLVTTESFQETQQTLQEIRLRFPDELLKRPGIDEF